MKKIIVTILTFFSFFYISNAVEKSDLYATFEIMGKSSNEIKIAKNENFKLTLSINNDEGFDIYAILGKLDYDKNVLELVDIKGLNDFTITKDKNVLADRIVVKEEKKIDVFELEFKVLKEQKTSISFNNIKLANDIDEKDLKSVSLECIPKNNDILKYGALGLILVSVCSIAIFKLKKVKQKDR